MKRQERIEFILSNYRYIESLSAGSEIYEHKDRRRCLKYRYNPGLDVWFSIPHKDSKYAFGRKIEAKWLIAALKMMAFPKGIKNYSKEQSG